MPPTLNGLWMNIKLAIKRRINNVNLDFLTIGIDFFGIVATSHRRGPKQTIVILRIFLLRLFAESSEEMYPVHAINLRFCCLPQTSRNEILKNTGWTLIRSYAIIYYIS